MKNKTIAIVGKGGTGKTTFTHLLARCIMDLGIHPLLIDADPTTSHLARSFKVQAEKSIEAIRMEVIKTAGRRDTDEKRHLAETIDEMVSNAVIHCEGFSILVLGQPETAGCFCPSNALLRKIIAREIGKYEVILIDCEAGMEQINREVIQEVDTLVVVCDGSVRSLETAEFVLQAARKFTHFKEAGIVLNKWRENFAISLQDRIRGLGVPLLGKIPDDAEILTLDGKGNPLLELPKTSESYMVIQKIVEFLIA